jgi:hypothetical protein
LRRQVISLSIVIWALTVGAASPDGPAAPPHPAEQGVAGNGLYCLLAVLEVTDEVARRCHKDDDPQFVAEVRSGISRLEAYVLANSAATPSDLEVFRHSQASIDTPDEALCKNGDAIALYDSLLASHRSRPQSLKMGISRMTSMPGTPTWGTCF